MIRRAMCHGTQIADEGARLEHLQSAALARALANTHPLVRAHRLCSRGRCRRRGSRKQTKVLYVITVVWVLYGE
jgi:hypothetical protein